MFALLGLLSLWFCCTVCSASEVTAATGQADAHSCCHPSADIAKQPCDVPTQDKEMPCKHAMKSVTLACNMQRADVAAPAGENTLEDWRLVSNIPAPFWVLSSLDVPQPQSMPDARAPGVLLPGPSASTLISLHTMLTN
jgi:hypothetical protein